MPHFYPFDMPHLAPEARPARQNFRVIRRTRIGEMDFEQKINTLT
jgi:hypothetical protein